LRFRSSRLLFWVGSLAVTVRLVNLGPGVQWASTSSEDVFLPYLSSEGLPAAIKERLICQVANTSTVRSYCLFSRRSAVLKHAKSLEDLGLLRHGNT